MKYLLYLTAILAIFFAACSKKNSNPQNTTELTGKWVRLDIVTDTLDFESFNPPGSNDKWLYLKREYKISEYGTRKAVLAEGPYTYLIAKDSIQVQWTLSSCMKCPNTYFFRKDENIISIGNFIDKNNTILTFKKIN